MELYENIFIDSSESNTFQTVNNQLIKNPKQRYINISDKCVPVKLTKWKRKYFQFQSNNQLLFNGNENEKIPVAAMELHKMLKNNKEIFNFFHFINKFNVIDKNIVRTKTKIKSTLSAQFVQLILIMCIISLGLIHVVDGK